MVKAAPFFDTTVLLSGLIEFDREAPAQRIFDALAAGVLRHAHTAWHCCLEFYAVATRLPPEFRLPPADAADLVETEILRRFHVHTVPADSRAAFFGHAAADRVIGGRLYDAHIAEVARAAGARIVVTDNRRHFMSLLRHEIRVLTAAEFEAEFL
jgi:predicted nucleic acid-binding protein